MRRRELTLWPSIEVRDYYWFAKWCVYPAVGPRVFGKESKFALGSATALHHSSPSFPKDKVR
jgi:hypothetical protein